jgi:hypothetical protein
MERIGLHRETTQHLLKVCFGGVETAGLKAGDSGPQGSEDIRSDFGFSHRMSTPTSQ